MQSKMKKNFAMAISWFITVASLACLPWLRSHCVAQNNSLRNLRADLWRHQVSMREKQVAIAEIISRTDENTRLAAIDLLISSAEEVDALRERNNIWNGGDELAKLKKSLVKKRP